jgi:hypothetical protein
MVFLRIALWGATYLEAAKAQVDDLRHGEGGSEGVEYEMLVVRWRRRDSIEREEWRVVD